MKRIILVIFVLGILFSSSLNSIPSEEMQKTNTPAERQYQIITNGTTCPMNVIPGTGWFCFFQLIRPWPDQMYYSFFGLINYEAGTTTIKDTITGETVQRVGAHKVLFYNFYGPVSSFEAYTVSLEGNAVFAMVIGG